MRKQSLIFPLNKYKYTFLVGILVVLLLNLDSKGQGARDSDHKADRNLKSSARINPATLAMEFSIPLSSYSGRAGNSIPVAFNYSSKVWTMRYFDFKRIDRGGEGTQARPFRFTTITSFLPQYGERTASGWTSSLQPISIVPEVEIFIGDGTLYRSGSNQQDTEGGCVVLDSYWVYSDPMCPGGRFVTILDCNVENQFGGNPNMLVTTIEICYQDPGGTTNPPGGPSTPPGGPVSLPDSFKVKRLRLQMPDGSSHEFRKDDKVYNCRLEPCVADPGVYLSVDGSGMKLITGTQPQNTLYMPDGARYNFGYVATDSQEYIDKNGNRTTYDAATKKWTDTMGREIVDPFSTVLLGVTPGTQPFQLPGLNGQNRDYSQTWQLLKPIGCVTGVEPSCQDSALENPGDQIYNAGTDTCEDRIIDHPVNPSLFDYISPLLESDPHPNEMNVWYQQTFKERMCGGIGLFNPEVLTEVQLPDGTKYKFRYNRYGEITKIIYPTGAYERFLYNEVIPTSFVDGQFKEANRGVIERWVSEDGINITQHWKYNDMQSYTSGGLLRATIAPDQTKIESIYHLGGSTFGLEEPRTGMLREEKVYSKPAVEGNEQSRTLLNRTLNNWIVAPQRPGGHPEGTRDARISQSVSILFENGQALATLSKTEYDENGSPDFEFFSHLNVSKSKGYHYKVLDFNTAKTADLETIAAMFTESDLASVSETDYSYNNNYKERGFLGLPTETRSLNPANPTDVLAKSQVIYDEQNQYYSLDTTDTTNVGYLAPTGANAHLRGNATTTQTWVKETNGWLSAHAQYDTFGNLRKTWNISGDPTKFVETQYSSANYYAYPTKVITPAPNDSSTADFGTTETSTIETTYDFKTGLPLSVKNDAGQITKTDYDAYLRPWHTYAENYAAPETQIIYGVPGANGQLPASQRFVKVRKQIDATNWDEATTWMDGLGRTIKTQSKDSQGDVFTETQYDQMGRAVMTTNPYRAGETKLWNLTEFDAAGRVYRSRAPVANQNSLNPTGDILGTSQFDISTVAGYTGTVAIVTDASGRRSRSITNALGQLLRVDEATAIGGNIDADLGTLAAPKQPTLYKYDVYGNMVKVTQGNPAQTGQPIQNRFFLYNSLGRLVRVRQPEQEINPNLNTTGNADNNSWTASFTHDIFGNVRTAIDARGVTITNTYDRANRVLIRTYTGEPSGEQTPTVYFTYDGKYYGPNNEAYTATGRAKGSLTQIRNGISTAQTIVYDDLGRAKTYQQIIDNQTYSSNYQYNFVGELETETYPSGRMVKNNFNADGGLSRIFGKQNSTATAKTYADSFAYTATGAIEKIHLGNGLWEAAKFNSRLQITELGLGVAATNLNKWKVNYEYGEIDDNNIYNAAKNTGNIAKQIISFDGLAAPFIQSYKYDALNRLKEARETNNNQQTWNQTFGYDRYGNRTSFSQQGGPAPVALPTINANTNRFADNQGYSYDKNGNVKTDSTAGGRQFTFDGDNKQTEVRTADGVLIGKYYYDGDGKRVKKQTFDENGQVKETTVFVYSGAKLIAEYSTLPPPTNPTTNYVMTDLLQSVRAISDSSGNITSRRDFMPFGEELLPDTTYRTGALQYGSPTDKIRQKFTGYQKDEETNLDFAEARMYFNQHGRFTAVDPLLASGKSSNPQTFNRYAYVLGNPLRHTDPTGLQAASNPNDSFYDPPSIAKAFDSVTEAIKFYANVGISFIANSDPLQNANQQVFQNTMNALNGDPAAADALNNRLVGNRGSTTNSVLQGATDASKRVETVANVGFLASNLTLGIAGMVGPGGAAVTTSRGLSVPGLGGPEPSGGGTIFTHFTDEAGVQGITGLNPAGLEIGRPVAVNQLRFGMGQTSFMNSGNGEIHITDLGMNSSAGQIGRIGVFESTGRQRFGIQFSHECLFCNGIRPFQQAANNFTIPGNSTLDDGIFTVTRRY